MGGLWAENRIIRQACNWPHSAMLLPFKKKIPPSDLIPWSRAGKDTLEKPQNFINRSEPKILVRGPLPDRPQVGIHLFMFPIPEEQAAMAYYKHFNTSE